MLRLLALCAAASVVLLISRSCRHANTALLVSFAVLVLPAALCWMGLEEFETISFVTLLSPMEVSASGYAIAALFAIGAGFALCLHPYKYPD